MQASDLISNSIFPLKPGDTCGFAKEMMSEWMISHLPVVLKGNLLGIISIKDIIGATANNKIDGFIAPLHGYEVLENNHLFQLLGVFGHTGYSILPVLNASGNYLGTITLPHLLALTSQLLTIAQEGAIISLEMNLMDYSLSEIARMTESDNIKIMGLLINKLNDSNRIQVHIKLNSWQINGIMATLNRYDYTVVGVYTTAALLDDLKSRFDSLMKYLDI
jgi:acetoin utilization protein AcuB